MSGGTFIRFRTGARGGSAVYARYVSRSSAVEGRDADREEGAAFLVRNLPEEISRASSYEEARRLFVAFARVREEEESRGRTHFRCLVSFERPVSPELALAMVGEWLEDRFPDARAAAFVHRNTSRLHVHVWIDAREISRVEAGGRKIELSPARNRSLGEAWNRIYCRELGLDEQEYLAKTDETRAFRRARARGDRSVETPIRAENRWKTVGRETRDEAGERGGLGIGGESHGKESGIESRKGEAERGEAQRADEGRPGGAGREPGSGAPAPGRGGGGSPDAERAARSLDEAEGRAVRETLRLRESLERMGEREDRRPDERRSEVQAERIGPESDERPGCGR